MDLNSNKKIYEVIRGNNKFFVESHNITYSDRNIIRTNALFSTPRIFPMNKLNKFIKPNTDATDISNVLINPSNFSNYGFTTNKELANCQCRKYNLLLEMLSVDSKLEELFEEENYYARKKQRLIDAYNKTITTIKQITRYK